MRAAPSHCSCARTALAMDGLQVGEFPIRVKMAKSNPAPANSPARLPPAHRSAGTAGREPLPGAYAAAPRDSSRDYGGGRDYPPAGGGGGGRDYPPAGGGGGRDYAPPPREEVYPTRQEQQQYAPGYPPAQPAYAAPAPQQQPAYQPPYSVGKAPRGAGLLLPASDR